MIKGIVSVSNKPLRGLGLSVLYKLRSARINDIMRDAGC
jgi:hypothetical protein